MAYYSAIARYKSENDKDECEVAPILGINTDTVWASAMVYFNCGGKKGDHNSHTCTKCGKYCTIFKTSVKVLPAIETEDGALKYTKEVDSKCCTHCIKNDTCQRHALLHLPGVKKIPEAIRVEVLKHTTCEPMCDSCGNWELDYHGHTQDCGMEIKE